MSEQLSQEIIALALDAAGIGIWNLELSNEKKFVYDERCRVLFGIAKGNSIPYEELISYIHPDDQHMIRDWFNQALHVKTGKKFNLKCRTAGAADGIVRLLEISGKILFDAQQAASRFSGTATDVSNELATLNAGIEKQKALLNQVEDMFRNVTRSSPTGLWLSDPEGNLVYLNDTLVGWTGMPYEALLGTGWANAVIDEDRERAAIAFMTAISLRGHYDVEFRITKGDGSVMWCRAAGDPYYEKDGSYGGYAGFCMDIDEKVKTTISLQEAEAGFRNAIEVAELGTWDLDPVSNAFKANERLKEWFGLPKEAEVPLSLAIDVIHEPDRDRVAAAIEKSFDYSSGGNYDIEYTIINPLTKEERIVRAKGKASFKEDKTAYRLNGTLQDITPQVSYRKKIEESEARFRNLINEAPVGTCLYTGREMRIELANDIILGYWGKGRSVIGKTLLEAQPEVEGQAFPKILDDVFTTGKSYSGKAARADLIVNGVMGTYYFDFTYKPIFNGKGEVYAILDTAIDVTEQTLARQQKEIAETGLREAIEIAELGTWSYEVGPQKMTYSKRMQEWYGLTSAEVSMAEIIDFMSDEDKERMKRNFKVAVEPGSDYKIDDEHTVLHRVTGKKRIVHSVGKHVFNAEGKLVSIQGTSRDVTEQRKMQLALENEVQLRTEELAASHDKLKITNDNLLLLNEKLEELNSRLSKSNYELGQYAYVASHDLQEPLRKIQVFSNILESQDGLTEENKYTLNKITQSSARMRLLIKDLLEFSQLLNAEKMVEPINLSEVIKEVVSDFELLIQEKKAMIKVLSPLPSIQAITLQMNQLFFNLLNNSLKFMKEGEAPRIEIDCRELNEAELKKFFPRDNTSGRYFDITVKDNGIGFETQYAQQIFEVFKRLHGRDVYPGSGIGLALCRRIADNHGGFLYAESEPGKGATFHIILPDQYRKDNRPALN